MRHTPLLCLALAACSPDSQHDTRASDPEADSLDFQETQAARGLAGAQGADARRSAATSGLGEDEDSGTADTAAPSPPADACDGEAVDALAAGLVGGGWVLSAPVFDARGTGADSVHRPAQVLSLGDDGCAVFAALTPTQTLELQTGFGSTLDPADPSLFEASGLMLQLVDQGSELWIFANGTSLWWSVDAVSGAVTERATLGRTISGATSDGAGGAYVTLSAILPLEGSDGATPGRVEQLSADGTVDEGAGWDLPFAPVQTGFGSLTADGTGIMPHFLSHDLVVGPDERVWVLDSGGRQVGALDRDAGTWDVFPLPVVYPTGIAAQAGALVVTSGLEADLDSGAVYAEPSLHTIDPTSGEATAVLTLSVPDAGWPTTGFASLSDPSEASRGVLLNVWMGLAPVGSGQLIVTDPASGRVLLIE